MTLQNQHDSLNLAQIRHEMSLKNILFQFYDCVTSTNEVAFKAALSGEPDRTVIVAEQQTAGKGRLNRTWHSPRGLNFYGSWILKPSILPTQASFLTLVAGIACYQALCQSVQDLWLKWPNDLWVGSKKLAGILTELKATSQKLEFIIVGIGVNLNSILEDFEPDLQKTATSVFLETQKPVNRTNFTIQLCDSFNDQYQRFLKEGTQSFVKEWNQLSKMVGMKITVNTISEYYTGICLGINSDGLLQVETREGLKTVIAGEIRPLNSNLILI